MSKHISRNKGATIKVSRKTAHDKKKNYFGAKRPFFSRKWERHQKKVIALNLYIGTNVLVYERWLVLKVWYTTSRQSGQPAGPTLSLLLNLHHRYSLCMWVKNWKTWTNGNVEDGMKIHAIIWYIWCHDSS